MQWSKCIPSNLKEHQRHLMGNLKDFTYPTAAKCEKKREKIPFLTKKQPFETKNATMGSEDHIQIFV